MMRFPAIPIIVHDPYFSIWQTSDYPTAEDLTHWSGQRKAIRGSLEIDSISPGNPVPRAVPGLLRHGDRHL